MQRITRTTTPLVTTVAGHLSHSASSAARVVIARQGATASPVQLTQGTKYAAQLATNAARRAAPVRSYVTQSGQQGSGAGAENASSLPKKLLNAIAQAAIIGGAAYIYSTISDNGEIKYWQRTGELDSNGTPLVRELHSLAIGTALQQQFTTNDGIASIFLSAVNVAHGASKIPGAFDDDAGEDRTEGVKEAVGRFSYSYHKVASDHHCPPENKSICPKKGVILTSWPNAIAPQVKTYDTRVQQKNARKLAETLLPHIEASDDDKKFVFSGFSYGGAIVEILGVELEKLYIKKHGAAAAASLRNKIQIVSIGACHEHGQRTQFIPTVRVISPHDDVSDIKHSDDNLVENTIGKNFTTIVCSGDITAESQHAMKAYIANVKDADGQPTCKPTTSKTILRAVFEQAKEKHSDKTAAEIAAIAVEGKEFTTKSVTTPLSKEVTRERLL